MEKVKQNMLACLDVLESDASLTEKFDKYKMGETSYKEGETLITKYQSDLDLMEVDPIEVNDFEQTMKEVNSLVENIRKSNIDECMQLYPEFLSKIGGLEKKMNTIDNTVQKIGENLTTTELTL